MTDPRSATATASGTSDAPPADRGFPSTLIPRPFTQVFIATLLSIALLAIEPEPWIQQPVLMVLAVWLVIRTLKLAGDERGLVLLLVMGTVPSALELAFPYQTAPLVLNLVKASMWGAFPFLIAKRLFKVLYRAENVTVYELYGVFTVYALIGWGFANLHEILYTLDTRSLTFVTVGPGEVPGFSEFLYFSFVTLGTLGYGDMAPVTHGARLLSMTEALVGLMFVAVVVGRMVGMETAQARAARASADHGEPTRPG